MKFRTMCLLAFATMIASSSALVKNAQVEDFVVTKLQENKKSIIEFSAGGVMGYVSSSVMKVFAKTAMLVSASVVTWFKNSLLTSNGHTGRGCRFRSDPRFGEGSRAAHL